MKISPKVVAPFVNVLYRLWCASLRYTVVGREAADGYIRSGRPIVFALWHNELFSLMHIRGNWKIVTVVSQSRDGEYLAGLLQSLGIRAARGSSSRGGVAALLRAARIMREEGYNGCITVDGPRGPRHKAKEGAIFLAHRTPALILPIRIFSKTAKVFRSWDRFELPLPFSRVHIIFDEPYAVTAEELDAESLERERQKLEAKLQSLVPPSEFTDPQCTWRYRVYSTLARSMQKLSLKNLHRLAAFCAVLFWHCAAGRRQLAIRAVQKHLQVSPDEAKRIARQSFTENFISFFEIFYAKRLHDGGAAIPIFTNYPATILEKDSRPAVAATAHIGSWELFEAYAASFAPHQERLVVVRGQKDLAMRAVMLQLRSESGMIAIEHRDAGSKVSRSLKKGGFTAFLVDHNCSRKEAVFLPFLRDTAAVNAGPALLALRAKAVVYPAFLIRAKGGTERFIHTEAPLDTTELSGTVPQRVEAIARFYTEAVERVVRLYPEQWFWMHQRWKTRPKDEN